MERHAHHQGRAHKDSKDPKRGLSKKSIKNTYYLFYQLIFVAVAQYANTVLNKGFWQE